MTIHQMPKEEKDCPPSPPSVSMENFHRIKNRGTEMRGLIVPSQRQRQLMRQVSGLGLEDPVFGNEMDDDGVGDSNIFDDMNLQEVPESMRDMLSVASDQTDVVIVDEDRSICEGEEKLHDYSTKMKIGAFSVSSCSYAAGRTRNAKSTTSTMSRPLRLDLEGPTGLKSTMHSYSYSTTTSSRSRGRGKNRLKKHQTLNRTLHNIYTPPSADKSEPYVPPQGTFENKKSRQKDRRKNNNSTTSRSIILSDDEELAAKVDDMLSMNGSVTSFASMSTYTAAEGGTKRQNSRLSMSSSSKYVPPSPAQIVSGADRPIQEEKSSPRFLPDSMDVIFPSTTRTGKI